MSHSTREKWRFVVLVRTAVVIAILVIALEPARLGANTDLLVRALLFSVGPWHLLLLGLTLRSDSFPWYVSWADITILAATSTLVAPGMWAPVLLCALAMVAVESSVAGRTWGMGVTVWSILAFTAAGRMVEPGYLPALMVAFGLAGATTSVIVGGISNEHISIRRRQEELLDRAPALVWEAGPDGARFLRGRLRELLGYDRVEWAELQGSFTVLIHPDDRGRLATTHELQVGGRHVREFRVRHRDGSWRWLRDTVTADQDERGRRILRGVSQDITDESTVREEADRLRLTLGLLDTPVHTLQILEEEGTLRVLDASHLDRGLDLDDDRLWSDCLDAAHSGEQVVALDRGYQIWPLGSDRVLVVSHPGPTSTAVPLQVDQLTSLPDRTALRSALQQHFDVDQHARIALLVLDLNQFKEVNDTLGHAQGDQLLRAVAARLCEVAMPGDLVCRLGGDEFALLLVADGPERAPIVAADLEIAIAHPIVLDGVPIQAGASIGAACSPEDGSDPDLLLQRADVAMYQAKSAGETYRRYDPSDDRFTVRRLKLLGELPRAITENELVVHYQPKIDLRSSSVVGVEALVRWAHPEHGMVPPDEFIELAEVSGLVKDLTRQVLQRGVDQLRAWDDEGIHLTLAVNLSVRNFTDADLPIFVEQCLEAAEIDPSRLMLEITESEVMDDIVLALGVLERLSSLGVRSSVDDFGTGYSSLSYLRQLPIDEIKIDRSFVGTMAVNQSDFVIVRSIIELGHNLDLDVVAEGVEDEWTLDSLRALGCDQAQGYFFARPVPPDEIAPFVTEFSGTPVFP